MPRILRVEQALLPKAAIAAALVLCLASPSLASVYNIHLYTDSTPDFTTREDFVRTATGIWSTPQDQALAIWRTMCRSHRQTHATREDGRPIFDPIQFYNSYANSYCGYMAGYFQSFVEAMGGQWRSRYVELGDHTVSEASWDGGATWHLFDTSMVMYCLRPDGVVAGIDDIRTARQTTLSTALGATGPEPGYDYLYGAAPECMTNPVNPSLTALTDPWGYRRACDNPVVFERTLRNGADSYLSANSVETSFTHIRYGRRYRLQLRPGDTYTRYWARLGDTPDYYRPAGSSDPDATSPAGGLHGTGLWTFAPDLADPDYVDSIHDQQGLVHVSTAGPGPNLRPAAAGATGALELKVDAANVVTSGVVELQGRRDGAGDIVRLLVSRDCGISWIPVWTAPQGAFDAQAALTPAMVGGVDEYRVRVEMTAAADPSGCGLDAVTVTTRTQLNRFTLPRLQLGVNHVRFELGEQLDSTTLWPVLHDAGDGGFRTTADGWSGVDAGANPDAFDRAIVTPVTGGVAGQVTWRLAAPTDIVRIDYGGSFITRVADPQDRVTLAHAFGDGGFVDDAVFDAGSAPTMDGRVYASVAAPAGAREVRLRYSPLCSVDRVWYSTGIQDALMSVSYVPRDPSAEPVAVTFQWTEHHGADEVTRSYTQVVSGDATWPIDVGGDRDPRMDFVRVKLADASTVEGYVGGDPGPGSGYDKRVVRFDWLDDVARGRPYTVSRPGDPANPDGGGELTDGCIVPPTTVTTHSLVQGQTAFWDAGAPVVVTVDLGQARPVAAVRVSTHQPNATWGHPVRITAEISDDRSTWRPLGEADFSQIWKPQGNFLDWGFAQSPDFADLPAGGRLSFPFWILPDAPDAGRWLRVTLEPREGCGIGLSEIQAFSQVENDDWPDREVDVPGVTAIAGGDDPAPGDTPAPRAPALRCSPNPFNPLTRIEADVARPGRVVVRVIDLLGRRVRTLHDAPTPVGRLTLTWDGRDADGRPAPAGVYLVEMRTETGMRVAKISLVK